MTKPRVVLAAVAAAAGAVLWMLVEQKLGVHHSLTGLLLAGVVGVMMQQQIECAEDRNVPIQAALIAVGVMMFGEFLTLRVVSGAGFHPLTVLLWIAGGVLAAVLPRRRLRAFERMEAEELGREDQRRLRDAPRRVRVRAAGPAQISCALCQKTVDAASTTQTRDGIVCEGCFPRAGAARISCSHCFDMCEPALTSTLEPFGIVCDGCRTKLQKHRRITGASVMCEVCNELVDAGTTASFEGRGIVCDACYQELEVGPNRDASFR